MELGGEMESRVRSSGVETVQDEEARSNERTGNGNQLIAHAMY